MRVSLPSFAAGVVCASVIAAVPTYAAITANDPHPTVFDGTTPALTVQPAQFVIGQSIDPATYSCDDGPGRYNNVTLRLKWDAADSTSGTASYDISSTNPDEYDPRVDIAATGATTMDVNGTNYDDACGGGFGFTYRWITARDHRGNTASSALISDRVDVWDENGIQPVEGSTDNLYVTRTGTWSTSNCTCHNAGKTTYTNTKGGTITYSLPATGPGQTVAILAPTSSNRGVMNISVDGAAAKAVNTYAATTVNRVIVWQQTLAGGNHTIKITNAGTAGHGRIDIDSVLLSSTWTGEAPMFPGYPPVG